MTGAPTRFRVIVTGWRHATPARHRPVIEAALAPIRVEHDRRVVLVHGASPAGGVDWIADRIARDWGWQVERIPPTGFGPWPRCGPLRNRYMCSLGADLLLAFPGPGWSKGTRSCWDAAGVFGIPRRHHMLAA